MQGGVTMDASGFNRTLIIVHNRGNTPLVTYQQERTSQDGW